MSTEAYLARLALETDYEPFEKVGVLLENDLEFERLVVAVAPPGFNLQKFRNFTVAETLAAISRH